MKSEIKRLLMKNRRSGLSKKIAKYAEQYLKIFYNDSFYDFEKNGERFVIETIAQRFKNTPLSVWDVGGNTGVWAEMCHAILPQSKITSFEIVPEMCNMLEDKAKTKDWWTVEPIGVSDKPGSVVVVYNKTIPTMSNIKYQSESGRHKTSQTENIECEVTTLDIFHKTTGQTADFIKIDVEGFDPAVIDGAKALLQSPDAPKIIQFEYGATWRHTERFLGPLQAFLEAQGYSVGRVYPNHVDFKKYQGKDDHFRMGNMVAVKDKDLEHLLHNQ